MEDQTDQGLDRSDAASEPDPAVVSAELPEKGSWRPADYYAAPPAPPRFPRWVPISCGVAAILALVLMFAVGLFLRNGGLGSFVALAIGQFQGELKQMWAEDVTLEAKDRLDESLRDVRGRLTSGNLEQSAALPLLQEIQRVTKDRKVTADEVSALQAIVDQIERSGAAGTAPVDI